jgi:Type II secretion system (T2SS), protein E, N-terminal domain
MNPNRRGIAARALTCPALPGAGRCCCQPLSSLQAVPTSLQEHYSLDSEKTTPATALLNAELRTQLATFFPRSTPLSLLLLHISQLEHVSLSEQASINTRQRYHAPAGFLEQVLTNVRRAIRSGDQILIDAGVGAAIIFPEVDLQGIAKIVERIYRSVSLLQAETVIPPLRYETDVAMGIGSYPEVGGSLEHLLHHVSITTRRFTLRPAITTQLWRSEAARNAAEDGLVTPIARPQHAQRQGHIRQDGAPFMQLPARLPERLKHLVPYSTALKLCCAPVGRDHHYLTIAMADPADDAALRYLAELTGLTIFPVACDITRLKALLAAHAW